MDNLGEVKTVSSGTTDVKTPGFIAVKLKLHTSKKSTVGMPKNHFGIPLIEIILINPF